VIQREIERAGVSTVSISLVKEFTQQVRPPRALWVPFPFGRPLGAPGERDVQRRVLDGALSLLHRDDVPVLAEHVLTEDEEHFDARWQSVGRNCGPRGCSLVPADEDQDEQPDGADPARTGDVEITDVRTELAALAPDHAAYRAKFGGRTQVGGSGFALDDIERALDVVHAYVEGEALELPEGVAVEVFLRRCIDDLKAYYTEARIGTVGATESAYDVNDWLWTTTDLGTLLIAARDRILATMDEKQDPNFVLARGIVPRGYGESGYGLTHTVFTKDGVADA
jgi:hypothetical protein